MRKRPLHSITVALVVIICILLLLSACSGAQQSSQYKRREISDERILSYFKGRDYFRNVFWLDGDNALFAFSLVEYEVWEYASVVYHYSISGNKFTQIFEGDVRGIFHPDQSICFKTSAGFVLMLEHELLFFDSNFCLENDKRVKLDRDEYFAYVSENGEYALIKDEAKEYFIPIANPTERTDISRSYLGGMGFELITSDNNTVLISESTYDKTTGISKYSIGSGVLSHLTCLDSLPEDDHVGVGILYPYDETHIMLRINGAGFTDFHDTYVLVNYENDTCEVLHRSSDISEFPIDNASGTWELEKGEKMRVNIYPFNDKKISVELEEPVSDYNGNVDYGGNVRINTYDYSFIYINRISDNERNISVYIRDMEKL